MLTNRITRAFVQLSTRLRREDTGATAVEYGLIVGLIAVVIIGAVTLLGGSLSGLFDGITAEIDGVIAP